MHGGAYPIFQSQRGGGKAVIRRVGCFKGAANYNENLS